MIGFPDADGTHTDGPDGVNDVILCYGGKGQIYAGLVDDDVYGRAGTILSGPKVGMTLFTAKLITMFLMVEPVMT